MILGMAFLRGIRLDMGGIGRHGRIGRWSLSSTMLHGYQGIFARMLVLLRWASNDASLHLHFLSNIPAAHSTSATADPACCMPLEPRDWFIAKSYLYITPHLPFAR